MVPINMISTSTFYDPWILPHPNQIESYGTAMPLTPIETCYDTIQLAEPSIDYDLSRLSNAELDRFSLPNWETISSLSHDYLKEILPSYESIMEVMALTKQTWEDLHHRSSFLLDQERVGKQIQVLASIHIVDTP